MKPRLILISFVVLSCTFVVITEGKKQSIRLIGIDAPESRHNEKSRRDAEGAGSNIESLIEQGKKSKEFLATLLIPGTTVRLEYDVRKKDKYGRLLCYVYLPEGRMLNELIVRSGFALASSYSPDIKYQDALQKAQHEAEQANAGLWGDTLWKPQTMAKRR